MSTLSHLNLIFNGELQIYETVQFNIKSKLPWCDVIIHCNLNIIPGQTKIKIGGLVKDSQVLYTLDNLTLTLYFNNVLIGTSAPLADQMMPGNISMVAFHVIFNTNNVSYIESLRKGDISFNFEISGYYDSYAVNSDSRHLQDSHTFFSMKFNQKFSEREWINILSQMGYGDKMIIAIDEPKLEGYHEVLEFIDKANDGLLNNANPDEIIKYLRSAWKKMNAYLKEYNDEIKDQINGGSKSFDKTDKNTKIDKIIEDTKTLLETLKSLEDDIYNLTHIGAHPETYTSNREDALLAFRLTASLMAYYSNIINKISKKGDELN